MTNSINSSKEKDEISLIYRFKGVFSFGYKIVRFSPKSSWSEGYGTKTIQIGGYYGMNEHFAKKLANMMWITFIVLGLAAVYYFMPEPVQKFIETKLEWIINKIGIK